MGRIFATNGIALTDSSGGTIVDEIGLVSDTQFTGSSIYLGTEQTTTSTTATPLANGTITFILNRTTNMLFLTNGLLYRFGGVSTYRKGFLELHLNGTLQRPWMQADIESSVVDHVVQTSMHKIISVGAGTHNAVLNFRVNVNDLELGVDEITSSAINLGK